MSGDDELPSSAGGFLGPVEAGEGTWTPLRPIHDPEQPLLSGRQKLVLVSVLLLIAAALTARHAAHRPAQDANSPPPPPYPSQAMRFGYGGPAPFGQEDFALKLTAHNGSAAPVDVLGVSQGYRGLSVVVSGWLPQTVPAGASVELRVGLKVTDCSAAPADAGLPFLDVTLRNTRAMETVSQILGDSYARDLSLAIHSACPGSDNRTRTPTASPADTSVR
ncbi:Tat pathway signal sequence domain protein [Kitasatospora sp. NPDC049285]|uniref:Tat pathway signal sequence domain protein n=1 Tax=Kitasatospora sp. NPDC049285 TaxID=3157096 RepID=UPI003428B8B4